MASQSFNLIGQEEEQELVALDPRQSRGPTPQSRPNSRMEEMLSQLLKSQDAIVKSQDAIVRSHDATAKSLENRIVEANKSLEAKLSGTDEKLSQISYTQILQIAEMSDLVDRMSTVYRKIVPVQPCHWIGPNSEEFNSSGACLEGQRALHSSFNHPSSLAMERSKTAKSSDLLPPTAVPLRRSLL